MTILEIREAAYKTNDARLFHLTDMLHNVPFALLDDNQAKSEYETLLSNVEILGVPGWLENRMTEFRSGFPEFE